MSQETEWLSTDDLERFWHGVEEDYDNDDNKDDEDEDV